jgi:hypothetical protein
LDIDDPTTTELRLEVIRRKRFLLKIYDDWYGMIRSPIPARRGESWNSAGAGYLYSFIPEVIRPEVFF